MLTSPGQSWLNLYVCSDDIHETTYEQTKTPARYQSPEPIIKKTVVNRELVSNNHIAKNINFLVLNFICINISWGRFSNITISTIVFHRSMATVQHLVRSKLPLRLELREMSSTFMSPVRNLHITKCCTFLPRDTAYKINKQFVPRLPNRTTSSPKQFDYGAHERTARIQNHWVRTSPVAKSGDTDQSSARPKYKSDHYDQDVHLRVARSAGDVSTRWQCARKRRASWRANNYIHPTEKQQHHRQDRHLPDRDGECAGTSCYTNQI